MINTEDWNRQWSLYSFEFNLYNRSFAMLYLSNLFIWKYLISDILNACLIRWDTTESCLKPFIFYP